MRGKLENNFKYSSTLSGVTTNDKLDSDNLLMCFLCLCVGGFRCFRQRQQPSRQAPACCPVAKARCKQACVIYQARGSRLHWQCKFTVL